MPESREPTVERERTLAARALQQAAVAQLGRRALLEADLDNLMQTAARAIVDTLEVELASVLELLPTGDRLLMRAGAGWPADVLGQEVILTEETQAGLTLERGEPVVVDNLPDDPLVRGSTLLLRHGAISGVSVLIRGRERPFGVLGAHARSARRFTEADVLFLRAVANVLAAAIQRQEVENAIRQSEARLRLALEAAQMGTWEWDLETGEVSWSETLEPIHGLAPGTFGGTFEAFLKLIHPEDRDSVTTDIARAMDEGTRYETEFRVVWPDGSVHWIAGLGSVFRDEHGRAVGMIGLGRDVTERRRREDALAFLAETGETLSSALGDVHSTLAEVARLAVPRFADCCIVDVLDDAERQLAVVHVDPGKEELVRELERRYPSDPDSPASFVGDVIRTGTSWLVAQASDETLQEMARDDLHLASLRRLGIVSAMTVPLAARGRTLGAISLLTGESGRRYGLEDLTLAEDLGRHMALALDNARLYRQRSEIAHVLQRSLLPSQLAELPGLEVAAWYRAAGEGLEVGGDFYDAFRVGDECLAIAIGDVCGKGAEAAALTGLARHTLRGAALQEDRPSRVLSALNEAILRQADSSTFCTVVFARLEVRAGGVRMTFACGGHPLPMVVNRSGNVRRLGCHGTLIGAFPDVELTDESAALEPGDAVVLYTDGLIDALGRRQSSGDAQLAALIRSCSGLSAAQTVGRIERRLEELGSGFVRDDVALLVVRVTG